MLIKLAFRNIFRHFTRTFLTFLAIALGLAMLILVDSMLTGIDQESFEKIINYETGHIKIFDLLKGKSFRQLQRENKVTDREARYLLAKVDIAPTWEEEKGRSIVRLGIDEHSFRGRNLVVTVTNLAQRRLKGILPDDRQQSLKAWLQAIPEEVKARTEE